ncbi:MAG TPA: FAD-dependent oxidoreductase [Eubacteriaceae bacterium]|jgi:uncharacterized FAD-dependent dehydrogenase|nr:FAD-dependent oxidoreductase [Eubacteriaceae bacterium]
MLKEYDIIIIGAGPAGIFTALEFFENNGKGSILILDMGREIKKRVCPARTTNKCISCKPCAITSGWSGAGAFSDGKLSLSPEVGGNILDYMTEERAQYLINYADGFYKRFGAPDNIHGLNDKRIDEIKYEASRHNIRLIPCPVRHLGTEQAFDVLEEMYNHLIKSGNLTFMELTEALDIIVEDGLAKGVIIKQRDKEEEQVLGKYIIAAPGRGGAQWLSEQTKKLSIQTLNNAVDIGVRVEVPNSIMDHLTKDLYEAKLVYYSDTYDNKVRTFCMNPGGVVSQENYEGDIALVNGHSYRDDRLKTENTNFALLVSTSFTQPFTEPIKYGRYIGNLANMLTGGGIMVQRLGDLLQGRRTDNDRLKKSTTIPTMKHAVPGDLSYVLPQRYLTSIIESLRAFDKIAPGLYSKNTLLYGVECKFYSSKVKVGENFETKIKNLYAIGDGAGITRGLMQSSITGIIVARDILMKMN